MPSELEIVERHVRPGGRLLDVGCGAGREAIGFARAGFRVVAIDLAPGMIEAARDHARREGLAIEFRSDRGCERLIEPGAALNEGLALVDDKDQIEIALTTDIAARERAEENRAPDTKFRQRPHDSLELCLEPPPAALARPPVHHLSDLRPAPDRHDARV